MARQVNSRIRLLLLCILLAFAALLARAAWIGTVRAQSLSAMAQVQTKASVVLPAGRGTIFDSMGAPLALGEQATTVFADPRQVRRPRAEARVAAGILGLKVRDLYPLLADRTRAFVYVLRKADPLIAAKLARKKLSGFGFYGEEQRRYPQHSVAAQVLGYAGIDNKGLTGLEYLLDSSLRGTDGSQVVVRDPFFAVGPDPMHRSVQAPTSDAADPRSSALLRRDDGAGLRLPALHGDDDRAGRAAGASATGEVAHHRSRRRHLAQSAQRTDRASRLLGAILRCRSPA